MKQDLLRPLEGRVWSTKRVFFIYPAPGMVWQGHVKRDKEMKGWSLAPMDLWGYGGARPHLLPGRWAPESTRSFNHSFL